MIEDHRGYAEAVIAPAFAGFDVQFAYNIPQGRALLLAAREVRAVFVDLDLPGGTPFDPEHPGGFGFELVAMARRRFPVGVPVIVLTAHTFPRLINQAHALGAEYLVKEGHERDNLQLIAERIRAHSRVRDREAATYLARLGTEHELTNRQSEILALSVTGMRHKEIAKTLGITHNTLKRHVDSILKRTNAESMASLRERFREAVWGAGE